MTLSEIVVDMLREKGRYREGQAYVAFSHVTELAKLHIVNYTCEQIRVSSSVKAEMSRSDVDSIPDIDMSWSQFTLRPDVLVRVCQLNTKAIKLPFMSKLLFLSNLIHVY